MDWSYDEETYPNVYTFSIMRSDGKFANTFEVSARKNEIHRVLACFDYLKKQGDSMVGFNNKGFDYPVAHKILQNRNRLPKDGLKLAQMIYGWAMAQIQTGKDGFAFNVPVEEEVVPQIDLFKIHHFDNKAKMTSLKMLEFNMRENNIEDLPFPVGQELKDEEIDVLVKYNGHDVKCTNSFYHHTLPMINFRRELTKKYNRDFMNHNDTKIGKDFFIMELQKHGIPTHIQVGKQRKLNQTKRPYIEIKKCLFEYYDFKRPEFIAVLNWLKYQIIKETKGVFTDIEEHKLDDVAKYAEMVVKKEKCKSGEPSRQEYLEFMNEHPCGWIDKVALKAKKKGETQYSYWKCYRIAETLNVVIDGFRFDFGTGGIHGSLSSSIISSDEDYEIVDADVASMYPNIAISNRVYPEHLTEKFCDIYEEVYNQRKSYAKGSAENAMLKLALNGVYGDSNNQYSVFFDPMYTMKITINGQLSLCLLAEKLLEIEGLSLIQVNTDGVTVKMKRSSREQYNKVCEEWQKQVKLDLEFAEYDKMFIRDVNNYIALYTNGKLKNKGAYEYKDLGWHKNHSSLVIPMAAEAAMVFGKDPREFIMSHTEKFDFMLRTKVPRSSRLVLVKEDGVEITQQNICRYYPCKSGGKLVKIMPPLEEGKEERRLGIDTEWNVQPCNNMNDFKGDIDYDYFVAEAEKLIIKENK